MTAAFRFGDFLLDIGERQLRRGGQAADLNARYFDALALLVREQGKLVTKDRFLDEVWRGIPVTDEALTQCIRTLRRLLDDDAASPRFIETVPKHGYRFVAPVEIAPDDRLAPPSAAAKPLRHEPFVRLGVAGTLGGAAAGVLGGLFYGFAGAAQPGAGAVSMLVVLVCLTVLIALIGGAGVAFGIAAGRFAGDARGASTILGGAAGGLIVGALVELLGTDASNLLFGRSPADITGALEGALLGGAVGLAAWLAERGRGWSLRKGMAAAASCGAAAGIIIPLLGGRLLGGSLDQLAGGFPGSRVRLDRIGAMFGEDGFGPLSQAATGGAEGLLFAAGVVGAMLLVQRHREAALPPRASLSAA